MKYLLLCLFFVSTVNLANDTEAVDSFQLELARIRIRVQTTVGIGVPFLAKLYVRPMVELHLEK